VLKTSDGQWLQERSTGRDFYFNPDRAPMDKSPSAQTMETSASRDLPGRQQSSSTPPLVNKQPMSQAERNRLELPDITKGVPWLPHEAPVIRPTEPNVYEAVDMNAVADSGRWTPPAGLLEGLTEEAIQVSESPAAV